MATEPSDALKELVGKVELGEIGSFELSGIRGSLEADGSRSIVGPGQIDDLEFETDNQVAVLWLEEGGQFLVRMTTTLAGKAGEIRVGMQAEYKADGLSRGDVPTEVVEEYVNRVAVMTLAPYVRQAVSDLALHTFGSAVTLGIMRPGHLNFRARPPENADL